jgi:hypothetical protein
MAFSEIGETVTNIIPVLIYLVTADFSWSSSSKRRMPLEFLNFVNLLYNIWTSFGKTTFLK